MRGVALDYEHRSLGCIEVPEPQPTRIGDVLVRISAVGVCGTDRDLARFRFGRPPAGEKRLILGHEALGQVVSTGTWVVPMIRRGCSPPCGTCERGRRDLCLSGRYAERGIEAAHGYFCEYAVDDAADLIAVPHGLIDVAVLAEPMSVVQKAVRVALALHAFEPRRAVVLGAGTIGMLAALVLRARGLETAICSVEDKQSARGRLVESAGIRYTQGGDLRADIVIEAAGAPEAATAGLAMLDPLGVLVILGAPGTAGPVALHELILGNRIVAGSVNSAPEDWATGIRDLGTLDRELLKRMIHRASFGAFRESILGAPGEHPKVVHMVE